MSESGNENVPYSPGVPPTIPGEMVIPAPTSTWPTVVGIIAIVLGALGILGGIWGAVFSLFGPITIMPMPQSQTMFEEAMQDSMVWAMVNGLLGMGAAVLLLVAGIGVVKRMVWSRKICMIWAVLKILVTVFGAIVGYITQQAVLEAMKEQDPNMASMPGFTGGFMLGGVCIQLIWGWALPVFMLIWFSRNKIKEEVAGWK